MVKTCTRILNQKDSWLYVHSLVYIAYIYIYIYNFIYIYIYTHLYSVILAKIGLKCFYLLKKVASKDVKLRKISLQRFLMFIYALNPYNIRNQETRRKSRGIQF